jgi:transposase
MESLFSYVSCEARVPRDHPVRPIRAIVDKALEVLSPQFEGLYATTGRPSIPPEKLLRALLVEAFYSVRSERQLMEQLDDNLLFRCSSGWRWTRPWDVTVFTKNRERLLAGEIAQKFLAALLAQPWIRMLLSDDPFSVDGTLIVLRQAQDEGLGLDEEPPAQGRERGWTGRRRARAQWRAQLPRREALERHPCLDHRPRGDICAK